MAAQPTYIRPFELQHKPPLILLSLYFKLVHAWIIMQDDNHRPILRGKKEQRLPRYDFFPP